MTTNTDKGSNRAFAVATWVMVAAAILVSCVPGITRKGEQVKAHEWDTRRGPVIPHDDFPADCTVCHESGSWDQIRSDFAFDHHAETGVALDGAHAGAECLRCHNDRGPVGVFAGKGCAGCHQDIHQGRLGNQCTECHNELDWEPSGQIEAHNQTRFPLVGIHAITNCSACHAGAQVGNFRGASTECFSCHQDDIARSTTFDHIAQGATGNCEQCHNPSGWTGAGFNHRFPIRGAHNFDCAECHQVPNDYAQVSCTHCHDHRQSEMDNKHDEVNGYVWLSSACIRCHPTGKGDD